MNTLRRRLLFASALAAAGGYASHRGLRYPVLSLEPRSQERLASRGAAQIQAHDAIITDSGKSLSLRATAPEPSLSITGRANQLKFTLSNISTKAVLSIQGPAQAKLNETIEGTNRILSVDSTSEEDIQLKWSIASDHGYTFAVIGDTGGGNELDWALRRASQLNALFMLHLGDFNYGNDEYDRAIKLFQSSPIPCYVSIGNHDFHDDGLIYQKFRSQIGPMNNAFILGGTQFINIDTAADFFPASRGLRGDLFRSLLLQQQQQQHQVSDKIFFTHRPLRDPRPHDDHIVGGIGEVNWLKHSIAALGGNKLLTGHVHHSAELNIGTIKQWTAGEGLGHEDIVLQRQVAQMLIGQVQPNAEVVFDWVDLNLPWKLHTSHTNEKKLIKAQRKKQLEWYRALLNS
jgi:hypothetical protein